MFTPQYTQKAAKNYGALKSAKDGSNPKYFHTIKPIGSVSLISHIQSPKTRQVTNTENSRKGDNGISNSRDVLNKLMTRGNTVPIESNLYDTDRGMDESYFSTRVEEEHKFKQQRVSKGYDAERHDPNLKLETNLQKKLS